MCRYQRTIYQVMVDYATVTVQLQSRSVSYCIPEAGTKYNILLLLMIFLGHLLI